MIDFLMKKRKIKVLNMNKKKLASISKISLIIGIILIVFALFCSIGDTSIAFWNFMDSNFLGKLIVLFSETIGTTLYNKPKIWTKNSKNSEFAVL